LSRSLNAQGFAAELDKCTSLFSAKVHKPAMNHPWNGFEMFFFEV